MGPNINKTADPESRLAYQSILNQIILIQQRELESRYNLENIKRNHKNLIERIEFLDQRLLNKIIYLFTIYFYPKDAKRHERDQAFESLIHLLHDPKKLISLFPSMPRIIWKFGRKFPKAMAIGLETIQTFHLSLKFEKRICRILLNEIHDSNKPKREIVSIGVEDFKRAVTANRYEESRRFFKLAIKIFNIIKDKSILDITLKIFYDVEYYMQSSNENFSEHIRAMEFGKNVLVEARNAFKDLSRTEINALLDAVGYIEKQYLDSMYKVRNEG